MEHSHILPTLCFAGFSGSGKTTLIEQLIFNLSEQGLRIYAIKHHGHRGFDIDVPGKDSYRFTAAGAALTIVASPDKFALVRELDDDPGLATIIANLELNIEQGTTPRPDLLLVEGYKSSGLPCVMIDRASNANPKHIQLAEVENPVGVVTDVAETIADAQALGIPVFAFEETERLATFAKSFI
ncbi:MAG: molybdopterin-guanine dinucleotide biosynthesis protein B [Coriobacteriales bacterium]|jgi:molybdopterin-guanine dinucleotide biosynthesis protein MobB|nr:molybdopterin-guanine dinucleotide biosynthesis protein B [Coriobacteriales bacterium]